MKNEICVKKYIIWVKWIISSFTQELYLSTILRCILDLSILILYFYSTTFQREMLYFLLHYSTCIWQLLQVAFQIKILHKKYIMNLQCIDMIKLQ